MTAASKRWLIVVLLVALILGATFAGATAAPPAAAIPGQSPAGSAPGILDPAATPAAALAALQRQIDAVLKQNHTPGAGVAIVRRDGPEWIAGLGLADVAAHRPVTPDTLFRIGSLSKSFVALSILKLQEEGKLNLQDTLKSRAPDLACENPWEQTDPVRIVHLLEHTAGWDDLGLRDLAFQPDQEATLQEALALRPIARLSRWRPGTRCSYSNVGSAAAAYVVAKVTGQRFEDYVEQNWFRPLGMTTASYWGTPEVQSRLTKLYFADGTTPLPYDKISLRPAGAINASVRELANYLQFYLNRGAFGGVQLLPAAAIERMERATTSYAAREGLGGGYGLANYAMVQDGWVYHGHQGAVKGGLTELAYLPAAGVGYVVVTNSAHQNALSGIGSLIRHHITGSLPAPVKPSVVHVSPALAHDYAGWYELASPPWESNRFILRLSLLSMVRFTETELRWRRLTRRPQVFAAVSDRFFRRAGEPVPTLALIADRSEGTLIQTTVPACGFTLRRVPGWQVALQLGTCAVTALLMLTTAAFALVWVPRKLFGRMRGGGHLSVRLLPLLATLSAACLAEYFLRGIPDTIPRFGQMTPWSLALFLLTLALPAFAVAGVVQAVRHRHAEMRRLVWWHSLATSVAMTIVSLYLAYWGVIGLRTWV